MARNKLPLARSEKQRGVPFDTPGLQAAKETASLWEAAEYLFIQVKSKIKAAGMGLELQSVLANVADFAAKKKLEGDRPSAFTYRSEADVKDDFGTLQDNLAQTALRSLAEHTTPGSPIIMGYAVSDNSQLLRVYSQDGKLLAPEAEAAMDTLFNACISTGDAPMLSEEGVLYEALGKDKQKDAAGNFVKAQKEKAQEAIQEGFPQFVKQIDTGLEEDSTSVRDIVIQEHPYPVAVAEKPTAVAPATTKPGAPAVTETSPSTAPAAVEPETPAAPSAGGGMGS